MLDQSVPHNVSYGFGIKISVGEAPLQDVWLMEAGGDRKLVILDCVPMLVGRIVPNACRSESAYVYGLLEATFPSSRELGLADFTWAVSDCAGVRFAHTSCVLSLIHSLLSQFNFDAMFSSIRSVIV